ncbi:hypothetical protein ACOKM5_12465 [Streptomyces sp. BH097]|uniref:hypothetical protein n=1 Tax=unclassified Streptomyces TaxID=2593676 RepID=UPI003BB4FF6D
MSSADHISSTTAPAFRRVGPGPRRAGVGFAALGLATLAPILPLWLFSANPEWRRTAILLALGCALVCVGGLAAFQRSAGGRQPYSSIAHAEFSGSVETGGLPATGPQQPPRALPSRRGMMARSFAWYLGVSTALVTLLALAMGTPQRPAPMQQIVDAGAEFANVRVEKVRDVQFHDPSRGRSYYTSTAVVRLPRGAGEDSMAATVHPRTDDRPHPEIDVSVLYAPSQPELGAVAGDEDTLGFALDGFTLRASARWVIGIAWAIGLALSLFGISLTYGFRSFSRLRGTSMAVRVTFLSTGMSVRESKKQVCLKVVTPSSRTAHFLVSVTEDQVPKSLAGQPLWLCWDARGDADNDGASKSDTPAALVSDDGWVMHGMLHPDDARMMTTEGVSIDKATAQNGEPRVLRLWDPHSAWPLYVAPSVLMLAAVLVGCAALLTFDIPGALRWVIGVSGVVIGLTLCVLVAVGPHKAHYRSAVAEGGTQAG